ncbi:glycosyl transferase group 1 [Chloroherpeton thalassium ATCC 35110]|uniref:Glycosyl transferase group 1 n=1 Tax=Chloroherpeton thalassium (strain ATCC 35110 / GB-78) TaxID=517418 RepID=B3QV52_CHLT3|nr:glycosyltransferase family 4 protein [Chloroherpeton thalassium]ACF13006.1 glycosyl transferase group 1 [Chloroherpeton thalassium ATCC 35110]
MIESYFFPEILHRLPFVVKSIGQYNVYHLVNSLFDLRVSGADLDCDVFHGFEGCSLYSMRAAKKRGAITVLDEATYHISETIQLFRDEYQLLALNMPKWVEKGDLTIKRKYLEFKVSDYVFVGSEKIKKDFIKHEKRTPESIFVIPYGCNLERFRPGKKEDSTFRIVFVGIIGVRKGAYYILEAFKQLKLKNAEFILISPIDEDFQPIFNKYKDIVTHINGVSQQELNRYLNNASVFVLPSIVESFGMATAEAMACGVPVIVSENCGMTCQDGVEGFVVPIRNIEALKEKILFLYNNQKRAKEMGQEGIEYVKQFTWDNYYSKIAKAYNTILQTAK